MINNWNYHNLYMDYSSYTETNEHPSDIDMFYIAENNMLIVGEIKNERGKLIGGQRKLYEKLIDGWKYKGIALFIVHNKYVQNGDKKVDVPNCKVREYYYKGSWHKPKKELLVKEVLSKYIKKENKMQILSNREEMIFRSEYNGKPIYKIGLTKKDTNGNYIKGYMNVNFKKGIDVKNMTKIKIKNAWLDFYKKDVNTIPVMFISDFEIVNAEEKEEPPKEEQNPFKEFGDNIKTEYDFGEQIQIKDEDLPF